MYGIILLSILVAGGSIAWIADSVDDDSENGNEDLDAVDPQDPDSAEPEPAADGRNLLFDGAGILTGTDGNDTLSAGQDSALAPEQVLLLGGDDVAAIDVPFGVTLSGGAGNDHLTSTSVGNVLEGGEGNDTLYGIDANSLFGGGGDDNITFDSNVELNSSVAHIAGGAGDDTISVLTDVGIDTPDRGGAIVAGGDGSDVFEVVMHLENSAEDVDGSGTLETRIGRIADFDPSEDSLVIELDPAADAQSRAFSVAMEQSEENGQYSSLITFTFHPNGNIDNGAEAQAVLEVVSESPFGLNDLSIARV